MTALTLRIAHGAGVVSEEITDPIGDIVRRFYDLRAATLEGAMRDELIKLGWSPPSPDGAEMEVRLKQAADAICKDWNFHRADAVRILRVAQPILAGIRY